MADCLQVLTTTPTREDAERLAGALVERRLAACVQVVGPIQSTYRWQGQIEVAEEYQCVVKTLAEIYPELEQAIRELHPYEVPEILAVPVAALSAAYREWLVAQVGRADPLSHKPSVS